MRKGGDIRVSGLAVRISRSPPVIVSRGEQLPEPRRGMEKIRILVVEDEAVNRIALKWQLEKAGYSVATAEDGSQALEYVLQNDVDAIIMDIQMPVMDGIQAARIIRGDAKFREKSSIPIIALTAYAMPGDREKILAAGLDGYLAKPAGKEQLMAVLSQVLERSGV